MIPLLDLVVETAGQQGVEEIVLAVGNALGGCLTSGAAPPLLFGLRSVFSSETAG